jgi:hypothetical protein
MNLSHKDRLSENEVVFRQLNEQVQKGLDEVNAIAKEHDAKPIDFNVHRPLLFYCECSNEDCAERIKIGLDSYNRVHKDRDAFTIKPGHDIPEVDKVVSKTSEYWVVKKRQDD